MTPICWCLHCYGSLNWRIEFTWMGFIWKRKNSLWILTKELRVTSYYLLHKLRVTFYIRVTSYYLLHELKVKFIIRVRSYYLSHELGLSCWLRKFSLLDQLFTKCSLQNQVFLVSYYWAIYFMNECSNGNLYTAKLWHRNWKVWMREEFHWCSNKSSSTKSMYDKWNHIRNHFLLYHLLFTISGIPSCMCLFVKYYWISYSISYSLD